MTVVAVLGEKGGTGKTTFAANLAGMRANAGRGVLMIDADRQGSSSYWAAERARIEEVAAVDCIQQYGSGLARRIRRMSQSYDDIVIDVGAGDGVEMKLVLDVADCAVTPVKPAGVDVWTMGLMNNLVGQALEGNTDSDLLGGCEHGAYGSAKQGCRENGLRARAAASDNRGRCGGS